MRIVFAAFVMFLLSACSTIHRGVVAMKVSDTDAQICIGSNEVREGDFVKVFHNECSASSPMSKGDSGTYRTCKKIEHGFGRVIKILNVHYSVVQFPPGTNFSEGDMIEKHPH